jgi:hypothetical protein
MGVELDESHNLGLLGLRGKCPRCSLTILTKSYAIATVSPTYLHY